MRSNIHPLEVLKKIQLLVKESDVAFKPEHASQYKLNLLISENRLQYTIVLQNQILHLCCYQVPDEMKIQSDWVSNIISADELLNLVYSETEIYIWNQQYCIVPDLFFEEKDLQFHLTQNRLNTVDGINYTSHSSVLASTVVFTVSSSLVQVIQSYFKKTKLNHAACCLINETQKKASESGNSLFLNLQPKNFELLFFEKGKPFFFNSFNYTNTDDLLYHLLFVMKQLNINPENAELVLCADLLPDSELYRQLNKYIRTIKFSGAVSDIKTPKNYQLLPHFFYLLFCVSK